MATRKEKPPSDEDLIREIVLIIVSCGTPEAVRNQCKKQLNLKGAKAEQLVERSHARIKKAAITFWDVELGKSIESLDNMYDEAMKIEGPKRSTAIRTALAVRREKNRLLDLYIKSNGETVVEEIPDYEFDGESIVRGHLESLAVSPKDLSIDELARLTAFEFTKMAGQLEHAKAQLRSSKAKSSRKE